MRDFRRAFLDVLDTVHAQYRAARVEADGRGITLRHSPPPVKGRMAIAASRKTPVEQVYPAPAAIEPATKPVAPPLAKIAGETPERPAEETPLTRSERHDLVDREFTRKVLELARGLGAAEVTVNGIPSRFFINRHHGNEWSPEQKARLCQLIDQVRRAHDEIDSPGACQP